MTFFLKYITNQTQDTNIFQNGQEEKQELCKESFTAKAKLLLKAWKMKTDST